MGMIPSFFKSETARPVDQATLATLVKAAPEEIASTLASTPVVPDKVAKEETAAKLMEAMKGLNLGNTSEPVAPAVDHPEVTLAQEIAAPKVEAPTAPVEIPAQPAEIVKPVSIAVENKPVAPAKEVNERMFVLTFLKEVNDLVEKGQELSRVTQERTDRAEARKGNDENVKQIEEGAKQIEESLKALVEAVEYPKFSESLKVLLNDLQIGQDILKVEIQEKGKAERIDDNALLAKINAMKTEISALVNKMGTQLNFERIKSVITDIEGVSKEFREKIGKDIPSSVVEDVNTTVVGKVNEDLHGITMLVQRGSIVDLLMNIYAPKQ